MACGQQGNIKETRYTWLYLFLCKLPRPPQCTPLVSMCRGTPAKSQLCNGSF